MPINQGTRGTDSATYYYQENTDTNAVSTALGFKTSDLGKWYLCVANGTGAIPGAGFQAMVVDSVTGDITLTPNGSGSVIVNGPFIAPGIGFNWSIITGTSATMAIEHGYITNNAGLVTLTLPTTAAVGSSIAVTGKGAGGWKIAQNAGQTIYFGASTTTTGAGGSLASTAVRDTVELVCVTANNDWNIINSIGNITIV